MIECPGYSEQDGYHPDLNKVGSVFIDSAQSAEVFAGALTPGLFGRFRF